MDISEKERSIITLMHQLTKKQEQFLMMYFGLGGKSKSSIVDIRLDFNLINEEVIETKNEVFVRLSN